MMRRICSHLPPQNTAAKNSHIASFIGSGMLSLRDRSRTDNILRLSDDPDVSDAIKFLRAREIVHFQRFGEGLRLAKERLDQKNVYFLNPGFDSK